MPVYRLTEELVFPPPEGASSEGVVAIGGDLSPERLILAYAQGIFPWPHDDMPLLWFSPDPRFVLDLNRIYINRSLRKSINRGRYQITSDREFRRVIEACSIMVRPNQAGTWINREIVDGFVRLHELGFAHSLETWADGVLVGGLYGVSLGSAFFGESMFAIENDASKIAAVVLLGNLIEWGFSFVDCQVYTDHLSKFGAINWPRTRFLHELRKALCYTTRRGRWLCNPDPSHALQCIQNR